MATVIINNEKDLEKYRKTMKRTVWTADEVKYSKYTELKDNLISLWENTFDFLYEGKRKDALKYALNRNPKYEKTYNAIKKARTLASSTPTKDLKKKEVFDIYNEAFNLTNDFCNELHVEKNISSDTINLFTDVTLWLAKNNAYELREQKYYEFFDDPSAEYKNFLKFSEQDPSENTLIINCDIYEPDAVFDVYGNLEANILNCGFLGACGKVKGKEILCDALYVEELEADYVNCSSDKGVEYSHLDEMTFKKELQDAIVQGANPNVFFNDGYMRYQMVVGKMNVYDEKKVKPKTIKINDEIYSYTYNTHIDMIGGKVNVKKLIADNVFMGEANIENINVKGETFLGSDIINKNIKSLNKEQLNYVISELKKNPEKQTILNSDKFISYEKKNLNLDHGFVAGLQCNNLNANSLVSTGYLNANDINCPTLAVHNINAHDINSEYIYSSTVIANDIVTKTLRSFNKIDANNITITKEMELPNNNLISGNFNISKEILQNKPEEVEKIMGVSKSRPKTNINNKNMEKKKEQ